MSKQGEYFPKRNFSVPLALAEGYMVSQLTGIDIAFTLFLARCTNGWKVSGGAYTLDLVAARLGVSRSGLDKSIARLKRLGVIEVTGRKFASAHYDLTDTFRKRCAEHLETSRTIRIAKLNTAIHELALLMGTPPNAEMLLAVAQNHRMTGLTGKELAETMFADSERSRLERGPSKRPLS